ncbi:serine/threonine protein phosphatase [Alkalispirochaeta sphaeroplastigenens]|uniref:Serine/threonine protein phosphatase n=1 Tax=Alkalispirochaeta sphaeroplastigenens TaxID=1187066 RepID=A0A2S4K099_9SPIO|nr:SpoIIE family protein phosphatase [Alkalispirochaeta sphaeroplastigenens]POR05195.1 serine/threonine protein phosphatase [Alkalispirochaeta sphaeroplastigenens]
MNDLFMELEFAQCHKAGQYVAGDAFLMQRDRCNGRLLAVLSDGLGSGIKAGVLANMTAHMAMRFAASDTDFIHYAKVIMNSLPVCQVRKIAYATYTVVDCSPDARIRMVEQGNPPFILVRRGREVPVPYREVPGKQGDYRLMREYIFQAQPEDRIVFFSDGVTESGLGSRHYKLGWRRTGCVEWLERHLTGDPFRSARQLAQDVVAQARQKEPGREAGDDITCAVLYFRKPRKLLLASGPPFSPDRDREYANLIGGFDGRRIVSGGTTSDLVARELGRDVRMDLRTFRKGGLPPVSVMEGIDLVTEGILTLTETLRLLETGDRPDHENAAVRMTELLLNSDEVHLLVGTKINEAHQDPNLPVELEIRRSLMKRIATVLDTRYFKKVDVEYI